MRATLEVVTKLVEPLFLVENEYRMAMAEAERQFVEGLVRRIKDDEGYVRTWKGSTPIAGRAAPEAKESS